MSINKSNLWSFLNSQFFNTIIGFLAIVAALSVALRQNTLISQQTQISEKAFEFQYKPNISLTFDKVLKNLYLNNLGEHPITLTRIESEEEFKDLSQKQNNDKLISYLIKPYWSTFESRVLDPRSSLNFNLNLVPTKDLSSTLYKIILHIEDVTGEKYNGISQLRFYYKDGDILDFSVEKVFVYRVLNNVQK